MVSDNAPRSTVSTYQVLPQRKDVQHGFPPGYAESQRPDLDQNFKNARQ